ncbi:MAG TPA: hypothetical protein ENN69_06230 [Spirochaetia bacterium]|nr:hypothetical protein [Spirochaetia bacterium]
MAKLPASLIDVGGLSAVMILLLVILIPWPFDEPAVKKENEAEFASLSLENADPNDAAATPARIAVIFGYRAPAARGTEGAPRPDAPKTEIASWISYMGHVVSDTGEMKYFFKNSRTNQVLTLFLGKKNSQGWELVAIGDKMYTVNDNGTVYQVPR